jgi:glycosyltransferase involved in cell wall biosynthesis
VSELAVSAVVSTYERPAHLAELLDALRAQTLPRECWEVIVVDNGSGPATAEVLAGERARGELPLTTIRHEATLGPAGGRNAGWRAARAPLVAFTDDDCLPAPGWLEAVLATSHRAPGAIVQGRTEPRPDEPVRRPLTAHTRAITVLTPSYETCNIAYPRALLAELGGFDEAFGLRPAGEDTELAWRAIARGAETVFAPEALVHHAVVDLGWVGTLRDATRWGGCARMLTREPRTREVLYGGVFWNVWHYLLVRSALAALAPPWLRRAVLRRHLGALRRRSRSLGAGTWGVPYLVLYDLIETLAMVRGAIRNRTLVL